MAHFLHTADWQLGKPFAGVEAPQKRALLQRARLDVIARIGQVAHERAVEFVVVAGDMFDSPTADKSTVAVACSAIGALQLPVLVIPGNHDHGGPGSLWEQEFFRREAAALAPNLRILLEAVPLELDTAIIYPCPLLRRSESADTTQWLQAAQAEGFDSSKARLVIAHGSTQGFGGLDDEGATAANRIDLAPLEGGAFDYIALGDWHGTKQVGAAAWYAGTPELDRFPKGGDHDAGNVLAVEVARGGVPTVTKVRTAQYQWHNLEFDFSDDAGLTQFKAAIDNAIGTRADRDLLNVHLTGSLGIAAAGQLEEMLESVGARLLRLKLDDQTVTAPTAAEIEALTQRSDDPLIAGVARDLVLLSAGQTEEAAIARSALRQLHAACNSQ